MALVLIDGNSLINRAYYALPPLMGEDGIPTGAVYGFATMLLRLIGDYKPEYMAVAFDLKAPTFRHKMYDGYKATRKGMPDDLAAQMPLLKDMLASMNIPSISLEGYEADDIIGTLAKKSDIKTLIVTGDKDSFQLIDDNISVLFTKKGISELLELDKKGLFELNGLTPEQIIEYKALAGDSSDNIPGVAGIGEKTALSLLKTYGTVDGVYTAIDEIKGKLRERLIEGKNSAVLSRTLATIDSNVPLNINLADFKFKFPFPSVTKDVFLRYGFKTLVKRDIFDEKHDNVAAVEVIKSTTIDNLSELCSMLTGELFSFYLEDNVQLGANGQNLILPLKRDLLSDGFSLENVLAILKPYFENGEILKIVYDGKRTARFLRKFDIELQNIFDVKLAQYLIDMKKDYTSAGKLLEEYGLALENAGIGLLNIFGSQSQSLDELGMHELFYDIELPLEKVLSDMEDTGFTVDRKQLEEIGKGFVTRLSALETEIKSLAGRDFNINSSKQLATVLFDELGLPYPKKSKSYSTAAEILEVLAPDYLIVQKVLQYRFLNKLNGTYIDGLIGLIDKNGVIHTEFKQTLTTTGRLSSTEPNLQNIPIRNEEGRLLRKVFVAREGNLLVGADYSQIELRLMAHLSGDVGLIDAYKNGEDVHARTAAEVFGVRLSEVSPSMRRDAKAVNFGIIYGISEYGLARNLGIKPYAARDYIKRYFERFPGVREYLDRTIAFAKEHGYVTTIMGRKRMIPELKSSNFTVRSFGERIAMNTPLQGSAADIIKVAMLNVYDGLKGMKSKLILQVHDELIVDTSEDEAQRVRELLISGMEGAAVLAVPLKVEVSSGKNWYDCK